MLCFFLNDSATTEIYTLSLHDALPISVHDGLVERAFGRDGSAGKHRDLDMGEAFARPIRNREVLVDRKSTRLNSSHSSISYAVFCLKKKREQKSQLQYSIVVAVDHAHD